MRPTELSNLENFYAFIEGVQTIIGSLIRTVARGHEVPPVLGSQVKKGLATPARLVRPPLLLLPQRSWCCKDIRVL
eukprot:12896726-Prorocentrum_lima.AAC.1